MTYAPVHTSIDDPLGRWEFRRGTCPTHQWVGSAILSTGDGAALEVIAGPPGRSLHTRPQDPFHVLHWQFFAGRLGALADAARWLLHAPEQDGSPSSHGDYTAWLLAGWEPAQIRTDAAAGLRGETVWRAVTDLRDEIGTATRFSGPTPHLTAEQEQAWVRAIVNWPTTAPGPAGVPAARWAGLWVAAGVVHPDDRPEGVSPLTYAVLHRLSVPVDPRWENGAARDLCPRLVEAVHGSGDPAAALALYAALLDSGVGAECLHHGAPLTLTCPHPEASIDAVLTVMSATPSAHWEGLSACLRAGMSVADGQAYVRAHEANLGPVRLVAALTG